MSTNEYQQGIKIQYAVQLEMDEHSPGRWQDGSVAKLCERNVPQAHKPNENFGKLEEILEQISLRTNDPA